MPEGAKVAFYETGVGSIQNIVNVFEKAGVAMPPVTASVLSGPNMLGCLGVTTTVGLTVTIIVLQHTVPPIQAMVIEQLCDSLNLGGVAYVHIPTFLPKHDVQPKQGQNVYLDCTYFINILEDAYGC